MRRIPISAAKKFVKEQDLRHVIICAWDGKLSHVVTYGRSVEDCAQAAEGGNRIKRLLGWPEGLQAEPARVKRLRERSFTAGFAVAIAETHRATLADAVASAALTIEDAKIAGVDEYDLEELRKAGVK